MATLGYPSYSREYPPLPQLVPPSPGSFYPSPGPSSAAEKSSLPSLEYSQVGANAPIMATASSSYSSPPLTATTAPAHTLPTPPTSESEIAKAFPLPGGREDFSNVGGSMGVPTEAGTPSSSMLSRRQNASLPAFSLPSSNIRSFAFNPMTSAGNTPSLLTPPSIGSENLSPIQNGTPGLYSNGLGYWSQPTPSPSAYSSYSSAPNAPGSVAFSSRNVYSPHKDRPSTPNSAEPSSYEGGPYSAPVLSPQGTVVTGALPNIPYNGYPFHHASHPSAGGPGSPHDQFSSASSLPPPTPHPLYPHQTASYSYSGHPSGTTMTAPHRPATSTGIPQLHPQPIHPAPPGVMTGANLAFQNRYLPGMSMSSSGLMSQHASHLLAGAGHGLGPNIPHPHLHHPHHGSHSAPQQDRPFKCDQCPQSFNRNHDLKRHRRIHLAVKPFPCPHCDKSFSRKDALKRHVLVKGCGSTSSTTSKSASASGGNREGSPSRHSVSSTD